MPRPPDGAIADRDDPVVQQEFTGTTTMTHAVQHSEEPAPTTAS